MIIIFFNEKFTFLIGTTYLSTQLWNLNFSNHQGPILNKCYVINAEVCFPEKKAMQIVKYLINLNNLRENIVILEKLVYGILGRNLPVKLLPSENASVPLFYWDPLMIP